MTNRDEQEMMRSEPAPGSKRNCKNINIDAFTNADYLNTIYQDCCPKILGFQNYTSKCRNMRSKLKQLESEEPNYDDHATSMQQEDEQLLPTETDTQFAGKRKNKSKRLKNSKKERKTKRNKK